jgi:orotate phosphoribosyltransferase
MLYSMFRTSKEFVFYFCRVTEQETSAKIADYLLRVKAVKLQPNDPFTWASGWKSPIYCDNRIILSHPEARTFVKHRLAELITLKYGTPDAIVGVATAGIAPGALVADVLNIPFAYVRSEAKKHGMGKQLEGDIKEGAKVVVIEDLVSTGKSSLAAVHAIRQEGCKVLGLGAVFSYGFSKATEAFEEAACPFYTLSNYDALVAQALNIGYIGSDTIETLKAWRIHPELWGV